MICCIFSKIDLKDPAEGFPAVAWLLKFARHYPAYDSNLRSHFIRSSIITRISRMFRIVPSPSKVMMRFLPE